MPMHLFDRSNLIATPWKNGGGVTREIACRFPPPGKASRETTSGDGAGHKGDAHASNLFDWRISIAHIASDSPFSSFDGVDRVITLLEGGGVCLQSTDGCIDHRLDHPLAPFPFAGEAAVQASLLAGDCHTFNVMTRRNRCRANVMILRKSSQLQAAPDGMLMAIHGEWRARSSSGDGVELRPDSGLWWRDETAGQYNISEWWLDAHSQGPFAHSHPEDDTFFVIEGTMSFLLDDHWVDAPAGSFVLVPGGTMHDFENRSDKRAGMNGARLARQPLT